MITNLETIRDRNLWTGLSTVGMCFRERTVNGTTTEEIHYFMGSGRLGPRKVAKAMRSHWGIENNLHWQLDVHFGEDRSRIQERNAARNFASMRKLAICVLKAPSGRKEHSPQTQAGRAKPRVSRGNHHRCCENRGSLMRSPWAWASDYRHPSSLIGIPLEDCEHA